MAEPLADSKAEWTDCLLAAVMAVWKVARKAEKSVACLVDDLESK